MVRHVTLGRVGCPFRPHADVFEPVWSTIFLVQPPFTVSEATCNAASALWRVWAVEKGYVLITNILEPGGKLARLNPSLPTMLRTNESCDCPRTNPMQYCGLERRPIFRKRSHLHDPDDQSTLRRLGHARSSDPQSQSYSRNDKCCIRLLVDGDPASSCYLSTTQERCARPCNDCGWPKTSLSRSKALG